MKIDLNEPINLKDYIQSRTPNKPELARLLYEAKGSARNMATFAKECGSSPSTFSRIANCKITQPIDAKLLKTIAENNCKTSVQEINHMLLSLLYANGMVDKTFAEKKKADPFLGSRYDSDEELFSNENETKNVITISLLERGLVIRYLADIQEDTGVNAIAREYDRTSFVLQIQGYEPIYHRFQVVCLDKMFRVYRYGTEGIDKDTGYDYRAEAENFFHETAEFFLLDAWEPDGFKKVKTSFVFTDDKYFNAFKNLVAEKKVNSWISLILVNLRLHSVVREIFMHRTDDREMESLFELPIIH